MRIVPFICVLALGAFLAVSCQQNSQPASQSASGPLSRITSPISIDTAKEYIQRFGEDRAKPMGIPVNPKSPLVVHSTDTRCIWFGIDELKMLLSEVEDSAKANGIRFYFATYDSVYSNTDIVQKEHWNRTTLILVSTRDTTIDGKPINADFYGDSKHKGLLRIGGIANHGEMCPPPPDCHATGAYLLQ
ncbi:hypothetical protein HF329_10915 [Chitinophaga oryzae]|uniref:Uncharacterized protein n=1 Tax=Chitinophaga oryzae TaxID=2725414 RepID=A0AAE6ZI06_9BACT|nr:hypothetical protein [Chitinophaga oryzae]QJB31804.1 hypothetical protein HF329_10915 [Chitinophaga oryzae]